VNIQRVLSLEPEERVVVVHVDDLGLCHAANAGALDALADAATCASIMVPCPAFDEIAQIARERPELDLGVHLTLNCEYEAYRWGPIHERVPSLCAPDGGLLRTSEQVAESANLDEVRCELRAQIDRAFEAGIDVTHLDAHMGTVLRTELISVYLDLAEAYALPLFLPRVSLAQLTLLGLEASWPIYRECFERAERVGIPLFDGFELNSLSFEPGAGLAHNAQRVAALGPGLSYLITHCAQADPELEAFAPDWR